MGVFPVVERQYAFFCLITAGESEEEPEVEEPQSAVITM